MHVKYLWKDTQKTGKIVDSKWVWTSEIKREIFFHFLIVSNLCISIQKMFEIKIKIAFRLTLCKR